MFRANAESNIPYHYYLRNNCYPLLDHLIQGIDNRFDKYGSTVYLMFELIPSVIVERDITVNDIVEQYQDDLTMPINAEKDFLFDEKEAWSPYHKTIVHPPLLRL